MRTLLDSDSDSEGDLKESMRETDHEPCSAEEDEEQESTLNAMLRLRQHRLWKSREQGTRADVRARKDVGMALRSFGVQARGLPAAPISNQGIDFRREKPGAMKDEAVVKAPNEVSSLSKLDDAGRDPEDTVMDSMLKLRQHRLWKARETSVSPQARARKQVRSVIQQLGDGLLPVDAAKEIDPKAKNHPCLPLVTHRRSKEAALEHLDVSVQDEEEDDEPLIDKMLRMRRHRLWKQRETSVSP